jgi:hypothetical protein
LDSGVLAASLDDGLSDGGKNDWRVDSEGDWESHKGWDFLGVFNWSEGLLDVDLLWSSDNVVVVALFVCQDGDEFSDFGG